MEIRRDKPVEEFIGDAKSNKFKIGDDSVGIIIDSLINLYSDPIGSIVREVTSNCYDAHREKRLKRKGIIPMTSEDKLQYWYKEDKTPQREFQNENILLGIGNAMIFRDFGIGLSQQRVETIYTMFGNSTKRDNNLQIGGFGIGAKSPFSYTDTFYIIANHNGIKYSYMLYKGNDAFHMDMIKQIPTTDLNSTEVIIPIKEDSDLKTFRKSIEQQLIYFENIRYINVEEGLGANIKSIACNYEDDSLAIALDLKSTNIDRELHCMVGRVRYPLDFNVIDDNHIKTQEAPAAIKFAIGEIDLVPSRENIRYTDRTKAAIKAKMELIRKNCIDDCNRELNTATDFIHWLKMALSITKGNTWRRTFDSVFEIKAYIAELKKDDLKLDIVGELSVNPLLDKAETKLFAGFSCYTVSKENSKNHVGGYKLIKKVTILQDFLKYPVYYQEQNYEPDEEGDIKKKTFRKAKDMAIVNYVESDNQIVGNSFIQLRKNEIDDKVLESEKEIDLWNNKQKAREPKVIKSDFEIMSKLIDGCKHKFKMYDDFKQEVSDDLVGEYESDQARRKRLGKIFGRKLYLGRNMDEARFGNIETEVTDLGAYKDKGGIVIYGFSKDNELLKQVGGICRQNGMNKYAPEYANTSFNWAPDIEDSNHRRYRDFHEEAVILKVATNLKDQLAEFINVNDLFKMKHDIIKKWYTSHLIEEDTEKINFFQFFRTLNEDLFYKWRKLHRLHDKNYRKFKYLNKYQSDELLNLCKSSNLKDDKALETLKELKQYAEGLDLLKFLDIIEPTQEEAKIKNKQLFLELRNYLKFKQKAILKYKKIRKNNKKLVN